MLVGGEDGQAGVGVGLPGEGRGDGVALVLGQLELPVLAQADGGQAVEELALAVDRSGQVGGAAPMVVGAVLDPDLVLRLRRRALAHLVDQAAGRRLAVEHGGGALQHLFWSSIWSRGMTEIDCGVSRIGVSVLVPAVARFAT